jgi:catechol 2,3-dioxygenase-like lactoylglutathione lyase family enzyme
MIQGISHITLIVEDLQRTTLFVYYEEQIKAMGLTLRTPRPRVEGEGHSLYFYDWDGHLFELHTGTLEDRLKRYSRSDGY